MQNANSAKQNHNYQNRTPLVVENFAKFSTTNQPMVFYFDNYDFGFFSYHRSRCKAKYTKNPKNKIIILKIEHH